jgi:alkylation response protein AidB-like acyl-CoA dehydrogenase
MPDSQRPGDCPHHFDGTRPGIAQRALDEAVAYAKVRRTMGHRIIDHQAIVFKIADMQKRIDAAALCSIIL